jgi:hypothetical protein
LRSTRSLGRADPCSTPCEPRSARRPDARSGGDRPAPGIGGWVVGCPVSERDVSPGAACVHAPVDDHLGSGPDRRVIAAGRDGARERAPSLPSGAGLSPTPRRTPVRPVGCAVRSCSVSEGAASLRRRGEDADRARLHRLWPGGLPVGGTLPLLWRVGDHRGATRRRHGANERCRSVAPRRGAPG